MRYFVPFLLCATAWAQFDTSNILGTITDPSSSPVVNSRITLSNIGTGMIKLKALVFALYKKLHIANYPLLFVEI